MSKENENRWSRLARLGGLTSRVTSSYIGQKVATVFHSEDERKSSLEKLHIDNAVRIVDTMSKMKGAAMKIGQQLAVAASSMDLPPEVASILGRLHNQAEPVPFATIREDVENNLERPLSELFAWFDPNPLGTASLGQAHAARLHDGREVVVKVLHRGINHSVTTDLMALKASLLAGRVLRRDREETNAIFDELKERLTEELDYLSEARNLLEFGRLWENHPDIRIPTLFPALCAERVLTMDRVSGVPIDKFIAVASPQAKQRAGRALAELYFKSTYQHRILHADPHPGNYLFEADGRVGLLDFGCVKRFDEFWIAHYATAALAAVGNDKATCLAECRELGAWVGTDLKAGDALWAVVDAIGEPFRHSSFHLGGDQDTLLQQMPTLVKNCLRYPEIRAPKDLILMHRTLMGIYSIARKLNVESDWGTFSRPYAQYAINHVKRWD